MLQNKACQIQEDWSHTKYLLFDHNGMKLEISNRKTGKFRNTWKIKDSHEQPKEQIREEIKEEVKYLETNENGNNILRCMGCSKSSYKRKVHSDTCLPPEIRISNDPSYASRNKKMNK